MNAIHRRISGCAGPADAVSPVAMIDVHWMAVLIAADVHGLAITLAAGIRAAFGQSAGVLIGELELPLINLAECPVIALIGKSAQFFDGVAAATLGVAGRGGRSAESSG